MHLSTHDAISVPKGAKIVSPASCGMFTLAPAIIEDVRMGDGCAILVLDGEDVPVPTWLKITVDNDTPQRTERLLFAHSLLSQEPPA